MKFKQDNRYIDNRNREMDALSRTKKQIMVILGAKVENNFKSDR